jgi:hypothetical protein
MPAHCRASRRCGSDDDRAAPRPPTFCATRFTGWRAVTGTDPQSQVRPAYADNLLPGDDIFGRPRVEGGWTEQSAIYVLRAGRPSRRAAGACPVIDEPILQAAG